MKKSEYPAHIKSVAKRVTPPKKRNIHYIGFPEPLKFKPIEVVDYLFERSTPKCSLIEQDFDKLEFVGRSGEYYHIIGTLDGRKYVLICSI